MEYHKHVQLRDYNSFRTEAFAKLFCMPQSVQDIQQCLADYPNEERLIIGGGCNLFFTRNFDGLVIVPQMKGIRVISDAENEEENDTIFIEVNASEDWDEFVQFCVERDYAGLENLSFIPGTVGASPVQNIGAYGAEVKDCIHEVVAIDKQTGEVISFANEECQFAYRDSIFKQTDKYIIVSVVFMLKKTFVYTPKYADLNKELESVENPSISDVRDAVIRVRKRKLPSEKELPNAGSFFKNPSITIQKADTLTENYPTLPRYPLSDGLIKTSAAFLIDQSGYKGKRNGYIGTYPHQPLIVVNYGSADGKDIVNFVQEIQGAVSDHFGINLEPEVRIF